MTPGKLWWSVQAKSPADRVAGLSAAPETAMAPERPAQTAIPREAIPEATRRPGDRGRPGALLESPQLLSLKSAARVLEVPEPTVRKWIAQRRLPVVKLGRLTRLRACDLADVVTNGLPAPGTHPRKARDH